VDTLVHAAWQTCVGAGQEECRICFRTFHMHMHMPLLLYRAVAVDAIGSTSIRGKARRDGSACRAEELQQLAPELAPIPVSALEGVWRLEVRMR